VDRPDVTAATRGIFDRIGGLVDDPLLWVQVDSEPPGALRSVVPDAATLWARGPAFHRPKNVKSLRGTRPLISDEQQQMEDKLHDLLTQGCKPEDRTHLWEQAIAAGIVNSPAAMLLHNDDLFAQFVGGVPPDWSLTDTRALVPWSRLYLNLAIAKRHRDWLMPAFARARTIRAMTVPYLRWVDGEIRSHWHPTDDCPYLRAPLPAPTLAVAIMLAAKGDPAAMLKLSLELHETLAPLRAELGTCLADVDKRTRREQQQIRAEVVEIVRRSLGHIPRAQHRGRPSVISAFGELSTSGGKVGFSVSQELHRSERKFRSDFLLSDVASYLDFGLGQEEEAFRNLVRCCCSRTTA
jgi:hypothetical protein